MKNIYLFIALIVLFALSCTKTKTTVNNYTVHATNSLPAFAVNGITDITFTTDFNVTASLNLTVEHLDSAQENVTLSLSGLPAGVVMDTLWVHSGFPTYSTTLSLFDTGIVGGDVPGTYPLTLTAVTTSGKQKSFAFNLKVNPMPTGFLGKYNNCHSYCGTSMDYTDSVYMDPVIVNKIWFANYANSGYHVYGILTGQGGRLTIPAQTIGGQIFTGDGTVSPNHSINISISTSCTLNMF